MRIGLGSGDHMHWVLMGLGASAVVGAAMLRLAGGVSDFSAHAVPFWLFLIGLAGLFAGGWLRDKGRVAHGQMAANHAGTAMSSSTSMAPAVAPTRAYGDGPTPVPASVAVAASGLSTLQRSPMAAVVPAAMPLGSDDIMARIHGLETENNLLRAYLLDAKASIGR